MRIAAFIPAAGRGTRLYPMTRMLPKEMFPVGTKPLLHHLVDRLREAGIVDITIALNREKRLIRQYFGDGSAMGVHITYITAPPLGIDKALWGAKRVLKNKPFLFCVGDIFLKRPTLFKNLISLYTRHKTAVLALRRMPRRALSRFAVPTLLKDKNRLMRVVSLTEKPRVRSAPSSYASLGIMILPPLFWIYLSKPRTQNEIPLSHYLTLFAHDAKLLGCVTRETVRDCSTFNDFIRAQQTFVRKQR